MKPEELEPAILYANLMEEVRARLQLIEDMINGKCPINPMLVEELCWFQLRMLCETFACALLVAHAKLTGLNMDKLKRENSASALFKGVRALYENTDPQNLTELGKGSFYPVPYQILSLTADTLNCAERAGIETLPPAEFLDLFIKSHPKAHRGALMFMGKRAPYVPVDYQPIMRWSRKFANLLLPAHLIQSPDRRASWIVSVKESGEGFFVIQGAVPRPTRSQ